MTSLPKRDYARQCGVTRPYRPPPGDFRDRFLEFGFSKELREHYRTNDRCLARWIEQTGGDDLRAARSAITGMPQRKYNRSKRFVLARTLTVAKARATR